MGFDSFEKERLAEVLGRIQTRMDFVESSIQEVLHKVKLMMIKDQALGSDSLTFPDHYKPQELNTDQAMLQREEESKDADDDWPEDEETLRFNV